ncbi:hypothetical protein [Frigidibacter sp. SD6-1]|uniref:hypothetical protein n=1 Tax=Frigidibacter sp. SD6-1 TaxID=3032581 RepID=UPI0024DF3246|nr:hypothetical protein [Frigidibacter sp. SD6-1]
MARDIVITCLHLGNGAERHKFGNFAEDVARAFLENPAVTVDLAAVDGGSNELLIKTTSPRRASVQSELRRLLRRHMIAESVSVA